MKLRIPELKPFHGVKGQADDRGAHIRRPILFKSRLVYQRSVSVLGKFRGTGHSHSLAVRGWRATVDRKTDLSARRVAHDVVVVRQPNQDLIAGDGVKNHHCAMAAP